MIAPDGPSTPGLGQTRRVLGGLFGWIAPRPGSGQSADERIRFAASCLTTLLADPAHGFGALVVVERAEVARKIVWHRYLAEIGRLDDGYSCPITSQTRPRDEAR